MKLKNKMPWLLVLASLGCGPQVEEKPLTAGERLMLEEARNMGARHADENAKTGVSALMKQINIEHARKRGVDERIIRAYEAGYESR